MSSALIGKNRVSEAEVIAVPEVDWTDTFHPIHHKLVISALRTSRGGSVRSDSIFCF